jgi:hypothetical protein
MIGRESIQSTIKLAYDTYDDKTGTYTYKYNGQNTETYYETYTDWKTVSSSTRTEYKSLQGSSKWTTLQQSKSVVKYTWYTTRFWVEIPFKGKELVSGKYNIAIKQAGADLSTAVVLDPWYNSSWLYRKSIGINCTTNQTLYQMKLLVGYNSTAVGENVDCNSHCNFTTFQDLRFTTSDEVTLMPYWIEAINTTSPYNMATVWVNVTSISSFNTTVIYMYYGNTGASAVGLDLAAGKATFLFFDDFNNGTTLDAQWNSTVGTPTVASGKLVLNNLDDGVRASGFSASTFRMKSRYQQSATNGLWVMGMSNSAFGSAISADESAHMNWIRQATWGGTDYVMICGVHNGTTSYGSTVPNYNYVSLEFLVVAGSVFIGRLNDSLIYTAVGNFPDGALNPRIYSDGAQGDPAYIDWYFVAKYTANEPTWSSFGAEPLGGPTTSTLSATSITNTTAILGGNITALGGGNISQYGIQYGNTTSYGSWMNTTESKSVVFSFTNTTTGLTPGELYYYRAFANDTTSGIAYGDVKYFQTVPNTPYGFSSSSVNGTAIYYSWARGDGATNTIIKYADGAYPATYVDGSLAYNGTGTSSTTGGLTVGHTYYFRAWSWSSESGNTTYSTDYDGSFTTTYDVPSIATTTASAVGSTTATLNGNLTAMNSGTWAQCFFVYGLTTGYGSETTGWENKTIAGTYSKVITGLSKDTLYHYSSKAFNSFGTNTTGTNYNFTTQSGATVSTLSATGITSTAATLRGNVTTMGGDPWAQTSFLYGTTTFYGSSILSINTTVSSLFTSDVSPLNPGTTYHFMGRSTDGSVYLNGTDLTFTTLPNVPVGLTIVVTSSTQLTLSWTATPGCSFYYIRRSATGPVTGLSDGTYVTTTVGLGYGDTSLNIGSTYWYGVWGIADDSITYSSTFATGSASTSAVAAYLNEFRYYIPITITATCNTSYDDIRIPLIINSAGIVSGGYCYSNFTDVALARSNTLQPLTVTDYTASTKYVSSTADSGTNTSVTDAVLTQADDFWNSSILTVVTSTDGAAPQGQVKVVSDFFSANDSANLASNLTSKIDTGDTYTISNYRSKWFTNLDIAAYQQIALKLYLGNPVQTSRHQGLLTNSADSIAISDSANWDIPTNLTLSATVLPYGLPGNTSFLIGRTGNYYLGLNATGFPFITINTTANQTLTSNTSLTAGTTYLVKGTYTNNSLLLWINSTCVGQNTSVTGNISILGTSGITIGAINSTMLRDVLIGDTSLTSPHYVLNETFIASDMGEVSIADESGHSMTATATYNITIPSCLTVEVGGVQESILYTPPSSTTSGSNITVLEQPTAIPGWFTNATEWIAGGTSTSLPFYPEVSTTATGLGWTPQTLYLILVVFTAIMVGVAVGVMSGSAMITVFAIGFTMAAAASANVIGWWMIIVYFIFAFAYIQVSRSM